ncbi:MAG: rhomboid family intramembrane serine protease [Anaerolineae bacterium]
MLNEESSEKRHPWKGAPQSAPDAQPQKRVHPLEQANTGAQMRTTRFVVTFPIARPVVTYTLIAINTLIFIAGTLYPDLRTMSLEFGILYRPYVIQGGEYYRLFTSMFLHADITHLFFNMYSLYIIGRSIEWIFGWQRFLLIYLLGGLAGSVLFALTLGAQGSGLGASGAIFAIWGAEMIFIYRHRKELGAYGRAQLRNIVVIAVLNLLIGFANPRIGTWAHIGGFVGGLALTWWLGPKLQTRQHPENPDVILFLGREFDAAPLVVLVYCAVLVAAFVVGMQVFP